MTVSPVNGPVHRPVRVTVSQTDARFCNSHDIVSSAKCHEWTCDCHKCQFVIECLTETRSFRSSIVSFWFLPAQSLSLPSFSFLRWKPKKKHCIFCNTCSHSKLAAVYSGIFEKKVILTTCDDCDHYLHLDLVIFTVHIVRRTIWGSHVDYLWPLAARSSHFYWPYSQLDYRKEVTLTTIDHYHIINFTTHIVAQTTSDSMMMQSMRLSTWSFWSANSSTLTSHSIQTFSI